MDGNNSELATAGDLGSHVHEITSTIAYRSHHPTVARISRLGLRRSATTIFASPCETFASSVGSSPFPLFPLTQQGARRRAAHANGRRRRRFLLIPYLSLYLNPYPPETPRAARLRRRRHGARPAAALRLRRRRRERSSLRRGRPSPHRPRKSLSRRLLRCCSTCPSSLPLSSRWHLVEQVRRGPRERSVSCSAPTRLGARCCCGGKKVKAGDNVRCGGLVCRCVEHIVYEVALRLLNFCCWFLCRVLSLRTRGIG